MPLPRKGQVCLESYRAVATGKGAEARQQAYPIFALTDKPCPQCSGQNYIS